MAGLVGHAAVRRGRRRRRRADRVGAAPLGHVAAPRRLPDGRVHGAAVRRLRRLAADRRRRPRHRPVPRRRLVRDHDRAGDRRRDPVRDRRRDRAAAGRHRAAARAVGVGLGPVRALARPRRSPCPALARERRAHGDRADARARPAACSARRAWWGFDIAVLWAMFHAFGSPPPFTVIWMAYFIGMLGNLLPLPGGLGGVEGGMIGALRRLRRQLRPRRARGALLPRDLLLAAYAARRVAYFQLRRTVARWREEQHAAERRCRTCARRAAAGPHDARRARAGHGRRSPSRLNCYTLQSKATPRARRQNDARMERRRIVSRGRERDHRRQRPGRLHRGAVRRAREPAARS